MPPTDFVIAENQRSVPTAVAGAVPNSSTRTGVISEPPPTPVRPTMAPTRKPAIMVGRSMVLEAYPERAPDLSCGGARHRPRRTARPENFLAAIHKARTPRAARRLMLDRYVGFGARPVETVTRVRRS